jgi:hypothetical protein
MADKFYAKITVNVGSKTKSYECGMYAYSETPLGDVPSGYKPYMIVQVDSFPVMFFDKLGRVYKHESSNLYLLEVYADGSMYPYYGQFKTRPHYWE